MVQQVNFKPTSKRFNFIDRYQKAYRNTRISYQYGRLDGKKSVQLFFDNKLAATRYKTKNHRDAEFDIQAYGGQDMNGAQSQRERCLQTIVEHLFKSLGFQVEIEPKIGDYTPDVYIKKDNLEYYIELKAFHKYNICGDPEISQAMKYFEKVSRERELAKGDPAKTIPKSILITTGSLIEKKDSFLSQQDQKPVKVVKNFYKKRVLPRKYVNSMDRFTSKMMCFHASKKFERNTKLGFKEMRVLFPEDLKIEEFPDLFLHPSNFDVLILSENMVYNILKKVNLTQEAHYFKLIRETKLEKLVLNREILEF